MPSRLTLVCLFGVAIDLAYLGALAALLFANNPSLGTVGAGQYWLAVASLGLGLAPLRYLHHRSVERAGSRPDVPAAPPESRMHLQTRLAL
jgi:hypothetical protein